jgi:hypothetical protein
MNTTLPPINCRSPRPDEWIRVKPGAESRFNTPVLRDPTSGELYLVVGQLWPRLADRLAMVCPRLCVNHDGEMFVWPVPTPTPGRGGAAPWRETAGVLASLAEMQWCRVVSDEAAGQYVVSTLKDNDAPPPPTWPEFDFLDVLQAAFQGRYIVSDDHPLFQNWN